MALRAVLMLAYGLVVPQAGTASSAPPSGQPELMVYPTRIVFERAKRAAQLDLVNNSDETATYRLHLVERRMDADGRMTDAREPRPDERAAASMLRYSPRQVVLPPGGAQTVRIMVRKPVELEPGEYRSHLLLERIPDAAKDSADTGPRDGLSIDLTPIISVSIPLIVRHGSTRAEVTISDVALTRSTSPQSILSLTLNRSGNRSVYGDLTVTYVPPSGKEYVVGGAKGVAVYTPNALRRTRLALSFPAGSDDHAGALRIDFMNRAEDGGGSMAHAQLALK